DRRRSGWTPAGRAPGSFLRAAHRRPRPRAGRCCRRRWPSRTPSLRCVGALHTPRWRDCVTAPPPCQTRCERSAMMMERSRPHPRAFAIDIRIGPGDDRPVAGGLIALLYHEVHEIGVERIAAERDDRADALAEIEPLAHPLVPHIALRLGERDERLGYFHDGEAPASARKNIGRVEPDGPGAAFEGDSLHRLGAI